MKRIAGWMVGLIMGFGVATAWAGTPYVSGKFGGTGRFDTAIGNANIFFDVGFSLQAALGYKFDKPYRLEVEVGYDQNHFDGTNTQNGVTSTGSYEGATFMTNAYYDIPLHLHDLNLPMNPYFGLGLGVNVVRIETNSPNFVGTRADSDTDLVPAWQAMFGFQTDLTQNLTLTGELRLLFAQDPNLLLSGRNVDTNYSTQQILFGLRYRF